MDPLAEKHYNISPYVYCANNPVNLIDPDGMDWYKDKDGTNQYNPDLNKDNQKDILGKDQSYVGETYQVKDDDGNVTTPVDPDMFIIIRKRIFVNGICNHSPCRSGYVHYIRKWDCLSMGFAIPSSCTIRICDPLYLQI